MQIRPHLIRALLLFLLTILLGGIGFASAPVQGAVAANGDWLPTTNLPASFGHSPAVIYQGRVYLAGGEGPSGTIRNTSYYATIQSDGSLGAWTAGPLLPTPRHYHDLVKARTYLYVVGGEPVTTTIHMAKINTDGSLQPWQATTPAPAALVRPMVAAANGHIYIVGGSSAGVSQTTVYYAAHKADGSLNAWQTGTPLPQKLSFADIAVNSGILYVAGGYTDSGYSSAAYSVVLNENGSLGSWNTLPSLPVALANHGLRRDDANLYLFGGWNGVASQQTVYFAPLQPNGGLGEWHTGPDLPQPLHDLAVTSMFNRMYVLGGYNHGLAAFQNTVYYSQLMFTTCADVDEIPQSECEALVTLYQSSNGVNWTNNGGWLQLNKPCLWYGVTCANQTVQSLILDGNQLNGFIPSELGNLTKLETLNLANNSLSGALPVEISTLANLRQLFLDHNPLAGALASSLTQLGNLDAFWFNNTNLCERPDPSFQTWLAGLINLQRTNVICAFPAAPTNLQANALSPTEIKLQWTDNANNETGFHIFEGAASFDVAANTMTFVHSPVQPNSYHCYQLYAYNDHGNSDWTDFSCTVTPPAAPTVYFTTTTFSVDEFEGSATIQVVLNPTSGQAVTVAYTTNDLTAAAGVDYVAVNGILQFAPGVGSQYIDIPITNDAFDEMNETLTLDLSAPTNADLGALASATLTIEDDDPEPAIHFASAATSVDEDMGTVNIQVLLDAPSAKTVTVNYATGNGSASAGSDYTASAGALPFAPGETSKDIPITILPDALDENNETVNISLSGPTNGVLTPPAIMVLTIADDDPQPSAHFGAADFSVVENAASATITVVLSAPSALPITVDYATGNGSASAGGDYSPASATLSFSPGDLNKTFSVAIVDDAIDEPAETVNLALTGADNATVGAPGNATLTIVDNDEPPPVAAFSADPTSGEQPLTVTFTDLSTGTVTGWTWGFGDGATSTTQNPTHLYQNVGVYTVTLTASGPGGLDDEEKTNYITVTEPPAATPPPSLSIPTNLEAGAGTKLTLPISYAGAGNQISSLLFSLQYDPAKLHFDPNDASAVQFSASLPASAIKSINLGNANGELNVTIADFAATPQPLADGVILSITLDMDASLTPGETIPVTFGQSSFGAQTGDIDGEVNAGSLLVVAMPDDIALSAAPTSIVADGNSNSTITAIVRDAQGNRMNNRLVSFVASAGSITSQATTNANGVATATLTAATTVGPATVTATSGAASGQTTVQFIPGEVAVVAPSASVASIPADGVSSALISVLVTDAFAHPIPNQTVGFTTSLGNIPATAQTNGQGQAVAMLTSVATVGTATVTVHAGAIQQTLTVRFVGSALSGVVFLDQNHNGVRDNGEAGLANVAVTISPQGAGPSGNTSTGSDGSYLFDDLPTGNYVVSIEPPTGLLMTTPQSFTVTLGATGATAPASGAAPANPSVFLPLINR